MLFLIASSISLLFLISGFIVFFVWNSLYEEKQ